MIVMGLDIATTTGIARYDTSKPESAILCTTIKAVGSFPEDKAWRLARRFRRDLNEHGAPDYIVIEATQKHGGRNAVTTSVLNMYCGALLGVVSQRDISFETIDVNEWRKSVYGFAKKKGWEKKQWKEHARTSCKQMGIIVRNDDEAEAALIAFWGARKSQFLKLRGAA